MEEVSRGCIQHPERRLQLFSFENMRWNTITPTDIDGSIDFGGNIFVMFEVKYNDAEMPYGQRRHLQALADTVRDGGRQIAVFVVEHHVADTSQAVDVASCAVREVYYNHEWLYQPGDVTLKEAVDGFLAYAQENPLNEHRQGVD